MQTTDLTPQSSRKVVVGLTGGIGSGKSTVCELLKAKGAYIIDADIIARQVVAPGTEGLTRVLEVFGRDYLLSDGTLDRKKLGRRVFDNPSERKQLEEILHPLIRAFFLKELQRARQTTSSWVIVYAVPLLFETSYPYDEIDRKVVVYSSRADCKRRIMERDALSNDEAEKRISAQLSLEEKRKRADFVVENRGDLSDLKAEVDRLYTWLKEETSGSPS